MPLPYSLLSDLAKEVEPPDKGILRRTLFSDDRLKAVPALFGFALGEELSEHTASIPAVLHFPHGGAAVTLVGHRHEAKPDTWAQMPTGLRHSIPCPDARGHAAIEATKPLRRRPWRWMAKGERV
jgi:hypothetical protein